MFEDNRLLPALCGEQNSNLRRISTALNVDIGNRGNEVIISGEADMTYKARQVLEALWERLQHGDDIEQSTVDSALRFLEEAKTDNTEPIKDFAEATIRISTRKKVIRPRSPMQSMYIEAMQTNRLTFGVGPAGTGKTYLAVAQAVSLLEAGEVERIILCRPAVEAGEHLGFLPGEMKEKMDPYMRPLYDALHDTMYADKMMKKLASEEIEIAPLAFMRGRTLNNSFVILDEAQNATKTQMMMFLTRLGEHSHMVITGDPSQTDLPRGHASGLTEATHVLKNVRSAATINFTSRDVVRSKLVTDIIKAYEAYHEAENREKKD